MAGGVFRTFLTAAAIAAVAAPGASASVLYVGDSLGVGTSPYLEQRLGGVELEVDAKTGRPSATGVQVLGSLIAPEHDVVVFDLGTNDDPSAADAFVANLTRASEIAGDRCLVVATLNRPPLNGVPIDGLNRAVTSFAARSPNVSLVDWHAAVAADPGLLTDGVHPDGDGYAVRAGLFADAISACSSFTVSDAADGGGAPDLSDLPPEASGGSNDEKPPPEPDPDQAGNTEGDADPRLEALAAELARAIATGADFG